MFLDMLKNSSYIIANGRFESPNPASIPATFVRDRTSSTNDTISRTIVDYFTVDKDYWSSIKNCTVHRGSQLDIGFNPARPDSDPAERCDHELLTLEVEIDRIPPSSRPPITPYTNHRASLFLLQNSKTKQLLRNFRTNLKNSLPPPSHLWKHLTSSISTATLTKKHTSINLVTFSQKPYSTNSRTRNPQKPFSHVSRPQQTTTQTRREIPSPRHPRG